MSLLNVWIERDRALVGVDTAGRDAGGRSWRMAKMAPLVNLNAVLAFRGSSAFAAVIVGNCMLFGQDLETLMEVLPPLFPAALNEARAQSAREQASEACRQSLELQEVVLVGWSNAHRRMRGRRWTRRDVAGEFVQAGIDREYIAVWHDSLAGLADPKTPAEMAALASAQCRLIWEKEPTVAAGGEFIVAQLAPRGMLIGPGYELGAARQSAS